MKKLIIASLVVFSVALGQAQEVTVLDEVNLGFAPLNSEVVQEGNSFTFKIKNAVSNDLIKYPIQFLKDNFDIKNFIAYTKHLKFDSYEVIFNSNKGTLRADYDRNGNLIGTFQNFVNIKPPQYIMKEVVSEYKGWTVIKNSYVATTDGEILKSEKFKLRLEKDNKRKTMKIDGNNLGLGVASVVDFE